MFFAALLFIMINLNTPAKIQSLENTKSFCFCAPHVYLLLLNERHEVRGRGTEPQIFIPAFNDQLVALEAAPAPVLIRINIRV